jgi:hypothetical protein
MKKRQRLIFFPRIFAVLLTDFLVRFYLSGACSFVKRIFCWSGAWFNALSLLTLVWLAVFTLPKLYLNNKVTTLLAGSRVVDPDSLNQDPAFQVDPDPIRIQIPSVSRVLMTKN